jgi:hypothetical protein
MKLVKNEKVIDIMEKTLCHIDARLVDHGKRVAIIARNIKIPIALNQKILFILHLLFIL